MSRPRLSIIAGGKDTWNATSLRRSLTGLSCHGLEIKKVKELLHKRKSYFERGYCPDSRMLGVLFRREKLLACFLSLNTQKTSVPMSSSRSTNFFGLLDTQL